MKKLLLALAVALCGAYTALAQETVPVQLDIQIENFTDSASVLVFEQVSGKGMHGKLAGEISPDGTFSKQLKVNQPAGKDEFKLSISIAGPGWASREFHYFYVRPGGKVLVTAQDKKPGSIYIHSDSELNKTLLKFNGLTAKSREYVALCQEKIDSLSRITVETDEEYLPIEAALKEWRAKRKQGQKEEKIEKLHVLQQLEFNDCWVDQMRDITDIFHMEPNEDLYPLVEETLNTVPFEEKGQPWYLDQLSLIHPGEIYAMNDEINAELQDLDGNSYTLEQFRGKFVMLDFWGEPCAPCVASLPEMKVLTEELKDQLVIISVTQDYDDTAWRTATNQHKEYFTWYNLRDKQGKGGLWNRNAVMSMPTFVLLSPEGRKIDTHHGYSDGTLFRFLMPHLNLKSEATVTVKNTSGDASLQLLSFSAVSGIMQQVRKDTLQCTSASTDFQIPVSGISLCKLVCEGKGLIAFPAERHAHYTVLFDGEKFQLEGEENPVQQLYTQICELPSVTECAARFMHHTSAQALLEAIDLERTPMREQLLKANKEGLFSEDMYSVFQHEIDCYWRTVIGLVSNRNLLQGNAQEAEKMWKEAADGINSYALPFVKSQCWNEYIAMKATHYLYQDMESTQELFARNLRTTAYVNQYKKFLENKLSLENQYAYCLYRALMEDPENQELIPLLQDFEQLYPQSPYLEVLRNLSSQLSVPDNDGVGM